MVWLRSWGGGVFQQEIEVKNGKEGVMAEMPNFGYMLWSKSGEQLTDEEVQKKIDGGAKVVCTMPGLNSDSREMEDIVKKFFDEYDGNQEVLVVGLAKPGSWRMQYEKGKKMKLADVSSYKYALMVVEWAKRMKLDGHNMALLTHSAGTEAGVLLSKWFKIIGMMPALHLEKDPTFAAISSANVVANTVSEKAPALGGGVEVVQQLTAVALTGARFGSPMNLMHGERMKDGQGRTHDLAVTELCRADEFPWGQPKIDNLLIVSGRKDILTSRTKMLSWFEKWFESEGMGRQWLDGWKKMSSWFPDKITNRLKHDTVLTDQEAIGVIGVKLCEVVSGLTDTDMVEISPADLKIFKLKVEELSGDEMSEEAILKELEIFDGNRSDYTLKTHREIGMVEYLKTDVYEQLRNYLEKVSKVGVDDFDKWFKSKEGQQDWREMVVTMLENAKGACKFEPAELSGILSGKLSLLDPKIRGKVARFPLECEWRGWLTDDDLNNVQYRGRASRGDTLDPVIYFMTDMILRRLPGMQVGDMVEWERMAYEIPVDKRDPLTALRMIGGKNSERMVRWYKTWILEPKD